MPPIPPLTDALRLESERLRMSWDQHPEEHLDRYLSTNTQDPRINAQSILTRALLADTLFPGKFTALIDAEWVFGTCMTWITETLSGGQNRYVLFDALENNDASVIPEFILSVKSALQDSPSPIPDYVTDAVFRPLGEHDEFVNDEVLNTIIRIWQDWLPFEGVDKLRVLEPACGSANDYRQIAVCGLGRFLDYTGFDIARKNIANAQAKFPATDFRVGNILQIDAEDASIDYLFIHDLFEHLSPEALEVALSEVLRVTRKEAWLAFFDMDDIPEHRIEPVDDYHVNTLSTKRVVESLSRRAKSVQVIDIAEFSRMKTGFNATTNPTAKTLIVEL